MASPVGAILFLHPITLPISHSPFSTSISHFHFPLPFTTSIYHSHLPLPRLLPDAAALSSMQGLPRSGNSSAQTSASLHPSSSAASAPIPVCHGAPASNKPHPAEKSTPVWLAIWRTWAGFANSQHRYAAFATPDNICAHSSLLQH